MLGLAHPNPRLSPLWGALGSVIGPFWEALTSKGESSCGSQLSGATWEVTLALVFSTCTSPHYVTERQLRIL